MIMHLMPGSVDAYACIVGRCKVQALVCSVRKVQATLLASKICVLCLESLNPFGGVLQVTLDFGLSQQVYAKAKVKDVTSVGLWLGADVMLDYPLEEAKQLLVNS